MFQVTLTLQPAQRVVQLQVHPPALTQVSGDEGPVPPVVCHGAGVQLSV